MAFLQIGEHRIPLASVGATYVGIDESVKVLPCEIRGPGVLVTDRGERECTTLQQYGSTIYVWPWSPTGEPK